MLCGEYAVTIGVEALAVPVSVGQWMHVWEFDSPGGEHRILWEAKDREGASWLNESFALPLGDVGLEERDERKIIHQLLAMAPENIWKPGKSYRIETQLEFDRSSGLGSSLSLIHI